MFRGDRGQTEALDPLASSTNVVILDDLLDLSDDGFRFQRSIYKAILKIHILSFFETLVQLERNVRFYVNNSHNYLELLCKFGNVKNWENSYLILCQQIKNIHKMQICITLKNESSKEYLNQCKMKFQKYK